jgi:hypothetical protein
MRTLQRGRRDISCPPSKRLMTAVSLSPDILEYKNIRIFHKVTVLHVQDIGVRCYNIVTDLLKALLGNGSVNTFQHTRNATIRWKCLLCVREWTVAMQRVQWRHTTVSSGHVTCFLWCVSVPRLNKESSLKGQTSNEAEISWVQISTESRTAETRELELENWVDIPRWSKKKCQEDFIVIWSDSFCFETRCQETTSEDWESWCLWSGELESV